jgi:hypothetical protein
MKVTKSKILFGLVMHYGNKLVCLSLTHNTDLVLYCWYCVSNQRSLFNRVGTHRAKSCLTATNTLAYIAVAQCKVYLYPYKWFVCELYIYIYIYKNKNSHTHTQTHTCTHIYPPHPHTHTHPPIYIYIYIYTNFFKCFKGPFILPFFGAFLHHILTLIGP